MSEILSLVSATPGVWILTLGFLLGLKHATEADHLAAVSTIVMERKSLLGSALVGGLWGLGHTISLLVAGALVLLLNFKISQQTERVLEFCVGLMLALLGLNVLRKILQGGELHFHAHRHGGRQHAHPHIHQDKAAAAVEEEPPHTHHGFPFSPRAFVVGMIHGLAGSAALMLLILETIDSKLLGLFYIIIFGIGSIGGMMLMSFLVGLPFHLNAFRLNLFNLLLRGAAGLFSLVWGLKIVFDKGFSGSLFG